MVVSRLDYFFSPLSGNINNSTDGSNKTNEHQSQFISNCLQWVSSPEQGKSVATSGHRTILRSEKGTEKGLSPALLNDTLIGVYLVDGAGSVGFSPQDVK